MSPRSNRKPILVQRATLTKHMTSASYNLEPPIWSRGTGQRITWFERGQLIITWCHISKKYKENQGCMSLSTYYLEDGRHLARLHRRRRRRRAYAPTSNTANHDNHENINSWVSFNFLYGYGAPLGVRAAGAPLLCPLYKTFFEKCFLTRAASLPAWRSWRALILQHLPAYCQLRLFWPGI